MKFQACLMSATLLGFTSAVSAVSSFGPLVTPAQLSEGLGDVQPLILDIRGDDYSKSHIPGSISAPYGLFRGPKDNPGQVPDVATLEQTYEALGLDTGRAVVIVPAGKDDSDFGAAARVYWTLKSSGFSDLSILNGGALAWQNQDLAMNAEAVTPQPSELEITFSDNWTAQTEEVVAATRGEVDALLLDARPVDFYEGRKSHGAAARPGTLPGAANLEYSSFFDAGSPAMSSSTSSASLLEKLGVEEGEEIVSFCNTGHWAATNWFALSEVAGLDNVKLYPGSMVEYSNTDNEMENTPGVVKNFLNKIKGN
ncbi:sulfurtransferase [Granulosicoccus antarcticus]|uniref:Thiosulfate sulfurtransferase n=1 Tax=Granulosicoccus antarcticus IMCC3135 TaxID=1192854 RepID=A0A2Z2NLD8_9GAMM|nr:rhodanese-like domain-containing protein [Granulosicoccus antarcticus]ASJ70791.1 Thiosulfate sulfurtransferase [Granulosicoccus antarcticus IMCC3135]